MLPALSKLPALSTEKTPGLEKVRKLATTFIKPNKQDPQDKLITLDRPHSSEKATQHSSSPYMTRKIQVGGTGPTLMAVLKARRRARHRIECLPPLCHVPVVKGRFYEARSLTFTSTCFRESLWRSDFRGMDQCIFPEGVNRANVQMCALFALGSQPSTAPLSNWCHFCFKLKLAL